MIRGNKARLPWSHQRRYSLVLWMFALACAVCLSLVGADVANLPFYPAMLPVFAMVMFAYVTHRLDKERRFSATQRANAEDLYASTPAMMHSIDAQGRLIQVSDAWLEVLGYRRHEVLGCPSSDFLTAESQERAKHEVLPLFFQRGWVRDVEYQMRCQNGNVLDVLLSAVLKRDAEGRPSHSLAALVDITARKRAERELLATRDDLTRIFDAAPNGMVAVNAAGTMLRVNTKLSDQFGWSQQDLLGQPVEMLMPQSLRGHHVAQRNSGPSDASARVMGGGREVFGVHRDGREFPVEVGLSPVHANSAQDIQIVASVVDITARRQAELLLAQSEARYRVLVEDQTELVSLSGLDGKLIFVNGAYARFFGCTPQEMIGTSLYDYLPESERRGLREYLAQVIRSGATFSNENVMVAAGGEQRWVAWTNCTVKDTRGQVTELHSVGRDFTEHRQAQAALRISEKFLTRTGEIAGVGGWEYDLQSGLLTWSDLTRRIHGAGSDFKPTVNQAMEFYTPRSRILIEQAFRACSEHGHSYDVEVELTSCVGRRFWARATGAAEFAGGRVVRVGGAFQDISARKKIEADLVESHELMRVTLESIGDAVITTDNAGLITWLNPVAEALTGWHREDALGQMLDDVFCIFHADTRQAHINPVKVALEQGNAVALQADTVLVSRHGAEFGIEDSASPIRSREGNILGAVLVFHDVSERQRMSREMTYRATHDALSGLVNRQEFEVRLSDVLDLVAREHNTHVLMFIDLDEFKVVNDACGHAAGDQLLRQVSRMLVGAVRSQDTVARLGGDEFGVLLLSCTLEQGLVIAQKICDQMEVYRFTHEERRYRIGTSIGVVAVDARWSGLPAVLQAADSSCFAAKNEGRNRVHVWVDTDAEVLSRNGETQWANRIVAALDEGQFILHAQRIEPANGATRGLHCEILIRMRASDGSLVYPGAFMPAVERFHLASRLDRWVLGEVFAQLAAGAMNLEHIDLISVNLSGQSIADRAFHRDLLKMMAAARFDLHKLCLEITETAAITHLGDARLFIDEVRAYGVRVALDDFGAGASSFGYLRSLRVDVLKIDGQFITGLLDDPLDDAAVRCFVEVAAILGLQSTAEFVEREEVRQALCRIGVNHVQGYLLHRPEPWIKVLEDVGALLIPTGFSRNSS